MSNNKASNKNEINAEEVINDESKTKKNHHFHIQNKLHIFLIIIRIFFVIIFVISAYHLIHWFYDNKANNELNNHLSEYVTVIPDDHQNVSVNYEKLKQENNYFFAWLIVNGTNINYPVVHYTDNDYYLTHAFDNSNNQSGCPFIDYKAKCDGTDKNLVIYAHNRRNR